MQKLVRNFIYSAGAIFLFVATAMFLANLTNPPDLAPANDPIFHIPLPLIFWIVGGLGVAVALVCLFARNRRLQITLVFLFAMSFLACRLYVSVLDVSNGFKGYLGGLAAAFGIGAGTADALLIGIGFYLLTGCLASRFVESKKKVQAVS